jgi:hypothetical protein
LKAKREKKEKYYIYYHGTSHDLASKIEKTGLGIKGQHKTIYLTNDKREALINFGQNQSVVEVKIPKKWIIKEFVSPTQDWALTNKVIPPKYLRILSYRELGNIISRGPGAQISKKALTQKEYSAIISSQNKKYIKKLKKIRHKEKKSKPLGVFEIGIAQSDKKKHPTGVYNPFTGRFLPKSALKEYIPEVVEKSIQEDFEDWAEGPLEDYTDEDYIPFASIFTATFPSWKSYSFEKLQKTAFGWLNNNSYSSKEKMLKSQTYLLANTIALRKK